MWEEGLAEEIAEEFGGLSWDEQIEEGKARSAVYYWDIKKKNRYWDYLAFRRRYREDAEFREKCKARSRAYYTPKRRWKDACQLCATPVARKKLWCSRRCLEQAYRCRRAHRAGSFIIGDTRACLGCAELFVLAASTGRYCSRKCRDRMATRRKRRRQRENAKANRKK